MNEDQAKADDQDGLLERMGEGRRPRPARGRAIGRWITLAACLAAAPQLCVYASHVWTGVYPGSAYQPRLEALLRVSAAASEGGPFVSVPASGGYSAVAGGVLSDLGVAAAVDLLGRLRGRPVGLGSLGAINLTLLAIALVFLIFALPLEYRAGLVPLFLFVPLSIPLYRSPDTVAVHGALGAIAVAVAVWAHREGPGWGGLAGGLLLFIVRKARAVYGLYGLAAVLVIALVLAARTRRLGLRFAAVLLTLAALEVPWQWALITRSNDPRLLERGTVSAHQLYEPLLSGIGWSPNRWGLRPSDPAVATFVAERLGLPPVPVYTVESERRCREVYLGLWRADPLHILGLYMARLPKAIQDYFFLGLAGAALWAACLLLATRSAWRRGDREGLAAVIAPAVLTACLLFQASVIDPRIIYAYPLRFLSALSLMTALTAVLAPRLTSLRSSGLSSRPGDASAC